VAHVRQTLGAEVSERRACKVLGQPRRTQRYIARQADDEPALVRRMLELVGLHPRYGYRRIWALLKQEGWQVNRKRIWRLWKKEGLKVPQKKHKRRSLGAAVNGCTRLLSTGKDHVWAMDFVFDVTANGRSLKWLAVVDEFTRECLALEVARQFKAVDVTDVLRELIAIRGTPGHIRCDNGPEFIGGAVSNWLKTSKIGTLYIEPGSPWQNGYAESFNSRLRDELLAVEIFETLRQAKALATHWRLEYNHRRPHSSLDYQTPAAFAATCVPRPALRLAALASATAAERTWRGDSVTTLS
jgi:transposase InsO family protein